MWYAQVKQEYSTLSGLPPNAPAPRPLYCSTAADERIVGREFIILEFVPVRFTRTVIIDTPCSWSWLSYLVRSQYSHAVAWTTVRWPTATLPPASIISWPLAVAFSTFVSATPLLLSWTFSLFPHLWMSPNSSVIMTYSPSSFPSGICSRQLPRTASADMQTHSTCSSSSLLNTLGIASISSYIAWLHITCTSTHACVCWCTI